MSTSPANHAAAYRELLARYLGGGGEEALKAAYELGRSALTDGVGILDLLKWHQESLDGLAGVAAASRSEAWIFLGECASSFEMGLRGFQEANATLRHLNEELDRHAADLALANEDLQRQIRERRQIEEHLRQGQKLESIGTLARGVAHDFNNLLNIISAHGALAAMPRLGDAQRAASLEAIQSAVKRGAAIVRQLLTFSRNSPVQFGSVDVNGVITELVALLGETFPKTIALALNLAPDLPRVSADHGQLTQALLNLCLNACDAMPDGGTLTVSTDLATSPAPPAEDVERRSEACVRIRVVDTGIGMDDATRERIFEPFFTTKERGKGAGIGLAVVYGILRGHAGHIDVASAPGRGSTFTVYLPVELEPAAQKPPAGSLDHASPVRAGGVILLIEDEESLLDALRTILEFEGFSVLAATDGNSGVALYESNAERVQLIVADLGLPGMTGWQAIQQIRFRHPHARGIVASGYFDSDLKAEMLSDGVAELLPKPYTVEDVLRKIRKALGAPSPDARA